MKKIALLFLLLYKSALFSQTILTSYPLDLKESNEFNQILNIENEQTHEVFVLISDNKNITILKYNSSLFLADKFITPLKNTDYKSLVGYSFSDDGNPTFYWASIDYSTILAVKFYFENKTTRTINFHYPSSAQYVVSEFQQNNSYNIVSKDLSEQTLALYTFKNGVVEEKLFDFSAFHFQDKNGKAQSFSKIIRENPVEKMEASDYNPLYKGTAKSKLYVLPNHMILTLDHNPKKTQIFDLNLDTEEIKEKNFTKTVSEKPKKLSNSFLQDNKLYQISANEDELLLDVKDYNSDQTLKSIKISKNDTIRFKISPLIIQREGQKQSELKTTKKFLKHLSYLDVGVSVFKNNQNTYITLGGTPKMMNENNAPLYNYGFFDSEFEQMFPQYNSVGINVHSENVYFESVFDANYTFVNQEKLEPLALDNIYYFLNMNQNAMLENILKFKDFYILGYYDRASKQYVMRRFQDGFNLDDPLLDPHNYPSAFKKRLPPKRP